MSDAPMLREHRVERSQQRDGGDEPREHDARARLGARVDAAEQCAAEAGERGGNHDRLLRGRRVERLVRRDLADDRIETPFST